MGSKEIQRTVCVKLDIQPSAEKIIQETIDQYLWAANHVVNKAWSDTDDEPQTLSRTDLHDETYDAVRESTDLHASHVQLARNRAAEAMTAVVERRNQDRIAGRPTFTSIFLDFNERCITLNDRYATLATIDGRVRAEFVIPDDEDTPHHQYLLNPKYDPGRCTLTRRNNEFYLHVNLEHVASVERLAVDQPGILGIDLGISNLAVTSTGRFWSGDQITHWREEYNQRRRRFQKCDSRWARENIQSLSQRTRGRIRQRLHEVANEILEEAVDHDCPWIAVEELDTIWQQVQEYPNIRTWAYQTLIEYLTYKGKVAGITIETVDPENTSNRCSTCGYIDTANRTTQDRFECKDCGYQNHADYNAAKNVGLRCLRQLQNGTDGCAPAGVRLNSGLVTQNGYQ